MLTGRDSAHKALFELASEGKKFPISIQDECIFYVGPTPAPPGRPIGAAGPTTSSRMDRYSPRLLAAGLRGMIGKGYRSPSVVQSLVQHHAIHFSTIGGLGAILAQSIRSAKVLAYEDLGTEAIRELIVVDLPVVVAYDCQGNSVYNQPTR
jgi:fumarate hydratase subunit beta